MMDSYDVRIDRIQTIIDWNFIQTGKNGKKQKRFLFRGVNDKSLKLIPKISRSGWKVVKLSTCQARYDNLRQYLKTFLPSYDLRFSSNEEEKLWIELFHAQHYGAPTPLLDFSRNPLVGLFFAVLESTSPKRDGMVYAIENMEGREYDPFATLIIDKDLPNPYSDDYLRPFFIDPPHENERIRAQHSLFCFFPKQKLDRSLKYYNKELKLIRFLVPHNKKDDLRKNCIKLE